MRAARLSSPQALRLLLKNGANINAQHLHGHTASLYAAEYGSAECLEILASGDADLERVGDTGIHPPFGAISNGHTRCIEIVLQHKPRLVHTTWQQMKPLYVAALNNHPEILRCLVQYGADIDAYTDTPGKLRTALHLAMTEQNSDAVSMLLALGANAIKPTEDGQIMPLRLNPLQLASREGASADVLRALVQAKGVDINAPTFPGHQPLALAVRRNHIETVRTLIDLGANFTSLRLDTKTDASSASSLYLEATQKGFHEVAKMLKDAGGG